MKRILVPLGLVAFLAGSSPADVFIRTLIHTKTVEGDEVSYELTGEETLWIGKDRLAYRTPDRILLVDRAAGKFVFANPKRKVFVEATLPLEVGKILSDALEVRFQLDGTDGLVRETGKSGRVLEIECKEYEVEMWRTTGGAKGGSRKILVLASADLPVPLDLSLYDEMLDAMRQVYNRSEELRRELRKIRGLQLRLEVSTGPGRTAIEEVAEIAEKEAPEGTYAVPEGFTKVETLSPEHL